MKTKLVFGLFACWILSVSALADSVLRAGESLLVGSERVLCSPENALVKVCYCADHGGAIGSTSEGNVILNIELIDYQGNAVSQIAINYHSETKCLSAAQSCH